MSTIILIIFLVLQKLVQSSSALVWLVPCASQADCEMLKNATCSNSFCRCNGHDFTVCQVAKKANLIGGKCDETKTCNSINSKCVKNVCVCNQGFSTSSDKRRCFKENLACSKHEECFEKSRCVDSICKCEENYVLSGFKCVALAQKIGDSCDSNLQCKFGEGLLCSQNRCQCENDYHYKNSTAKCVRDLFLGELCGDSEECHQVGHEKSRLICIEGVCKCGLDYVEERGVYCKRNRSATICPIFVVLVLMLLCVCKILK